MTWYYINWQDRGLIKRHIRWLGPVHLSGKLLRSPYAGVSFCVYIWVLLKETSSVIPIFVPVLPFCDLPVCRFCALFTVMHVFDVYAALPAWGFQIDQRGLLLILLSLVANSYAILTPFLAYALLLKFVWKVKYRVSGISRFGANEMLGRMPNRKYSGRGVEVVLYSVVVLYPSWCWNCLCNVPRRWVKRKHQDCLFLGQVGWWSKSFCQRHK